MYHACSPTRLLKHAVKHGIPSLWITDHCTDAANQVTWFDGHVHCIPALSPFFPRREIVREDGSLDPHLASISLTALDEYPQPDVWSADMLETSYLPAGKPIFQRPVVPALPRIGECSSSLDASVWTPPCACICLCQVPPEFVAPTVLRLVGIIWKEFGHMKGPQEIVLEEVWRTLRSPEARGHLRYLAPPWLGGGVVTRLLSHDRRALGLEHVTPPLPGTAVTYMANVDVLLNS